MFFPATASEQTPTRLARALGDWYWIGLAVGLGVALGPLVAALLGRASVLVVAALAAIGGAAIGYVLVDWPGAIAGGAGGILGGAAAAPLVQGTLARGGTRLGTALLVGGAALVLAGLAVVPAVGYVEAVALPLLSFGARRRRPDRHAGLRILARD